MRAKVDCASTKAIKKSYVSIPALCALRFGMPRLILGRRAARVWLCDASSACSSFVSSFWSKGRGLAMLGDSSPVARQAQASSDSLVLERRERWRSVCCRPQGILRQL